MLQDVPLGQAYSHVRHYGGGEGTPIFSHRFCANLVSGPGGQWGVQTPPWPCHWERLPTPTLSLQLALAITPLKLANREDNVLCSKEKSRRIVVSSFITLHSAVCEYTVRQLFQEQARQALGRYGRYKLHCLRSPSSYKYK